MSSKKDKEYSWRETHEKNEEWLAAPEEEYDKVEKETHETAGWELYKEQETCSVYVKKTSVSDVLIMKLISDKFFLDITPETLYDVLEDPDYRHVWDESCIECTTLVRIDGKNEINYYSARCPNPLSNRDWVNRCGASIRDVEGETSKKYIIFNRSVIYPQCPPKKNFERAISFVTAYVLEPVHSPDHPDVTGTRISYMTHNDWNGWIPSGVVNMVMKSMIPSVLNQLRKAALEYPKWKAEHNPDDKPWLH